MVLWFAGKVRCLGRRCNSQRVVAGVWVGGSRDGGQPMAVSGTTSVKDNRKHMACIDRMQTPGCRPACRPPGLRRAQGQRAKHFNQLAASWVAVAKHG
jgi:hypothetical protein